ncbi:MAG: WecB/TagA/CpsF family glycosyltransferase [Anaerolineae bacterium]|nr:WecB/TagA/CpsF family glycosyltransferase [Anaerolineae bacterium]
MQTEILGVPVDAQTFDEAIETLAAWARGDQLHYVCTCPVYTLMQARERPEVGAALRGADMVTADGMPVVWVQRRQGFAQAERVYGPDVLLALCEKTAGSGVRHYFYGGMPGVPEKLAANLQKRFPALEIAGFDAPPLAEVGSAPDAEAVQRLNHAGAHVIWVGLGSPKQDLWMALHRPLLEATVLIGVGAAFDFIAGTKRQAPQWMRRAGMEWLFRLVQEPGRLWRRYVVYNTRFLWALMQEGRESPPDRSP